MKVKVSVFLLLLVLHIVQYSFLLVSQRDLEYYTFYTQPSFWKNTKSSGILYIRPLLKFILVTE